jgi:hypothetical protein
MVEITFGKENFVHAEGINLSESGLLCETSEEVDPYSRLFIMLSLPGTKGEAEITCEGVIVRLQKKKKKFQIAVQFTEIDDDDVKNIRKFIK